jgi:hypothetical protein
MIHVRGRGEIAYGVASASPGARGRLSVFDRHTFGGGYLGRCTRLPSKGSSPAQQRLGPCGGWVAKPGKGARPPLPGTPPTRPGAPPGFGWRRGRAPRPHAMAGSVRPRVDPPRPPPVQEEATCGACGSWRGVGGRGVRGTSRKIGVTCSRPRAKRDGRSRAERGDWLCIDARRGHRSTLSEGRTR